MREIGSLLKVSFPDTNDYIFAGGMSSRGAHEVMTAVLCWAKEKQGRVSEKAICRCVASL